MPYYLKYKKGELENILTKIRARMYETAGTLSTVAWCTPEPVPFSKRQSGTMKELSPGQKWGELFECAWFHFKGIVPKSAVGKKVVLILDVNGEMCVVDKEGVPVRGLTSHASWYDPKRNFGKRVLELSEKAKGGEKVDVWADAGCNDLFGRLSENGTFKEASVAVCNEQVVGLYYDFEVLLDLMNCLPEDSARSRQILYALNEAALILEEYSAEQVNSARRILSAELKKKGPDPSLVISAVGHAHLDLAWLWPIRETIRKGARTFATAIDLIGRYPDYIFGASQAQLYDWMKDYYPGLYAKLKEKVACGRIELQGVLWVESDMNVPSGESIVRQFLYGRRFFLKEFGADVKTLWLPDVFGYNGALPQIMKKSGVDYFMTQKLSWNDINTHPHHSFIWRGIDGSEVLAHMPPEDNYNSDATPQAILKAERNYRDNAVCSRALLLFGIGDGGGGPGAEHLERLSRIKNISGLAQVVQESAAGFFKKLEKDTPKLKTWKGELYLEKHRGTYTTQARNKRFNRKMEFALRQLEFAASVAKVVAGGVYPSAEIEKLWKEVLLYQFHDILPGSSIKRVYDESLDRYEQMLRQTQELTESALSAIADRLNTSMMKKPALVVNSLGWRRKEWLSADGKWIRVEVPPMGYAPVEMSDNYPVPAKLTAKKNLLENDRLKVEFGNDGSISSIYDKLNSRQVIRQHQKANQLAVYIDHGDPWDAWDIKLEYLDRKPEYFALKSAGAYTDGPRAVLEQTYTFGKSSLVQKIILTAGSARLDFITEADWHESDKMLRTSFPLAVESELARCEMQFGNVGRPTHSNTSWDMAKFEVCAHKWVDISGPDYGAALLNDCKYGHRVFDSTLDLNLLRSPTMPDPQADRAVHQFTYSLLPHADDYIRGGVVRAGYELNVPLQIASVKQGKEKSKLPSEFSLISTNAENIVVETVKKAEDSDETVIRLYESCGMSAKAVLRLAPGVRSVMLTNMMEENPAPLTVKDNTVELAFGPFEIHTLRVSFQSN